MASLVLGVAGAVVGSFFGQPALGYTIGSMFGSALFPEQLPDVSQTGPRLNDRKVQISSYGVMIPIIFGSFRLAGNVIWSTDIIETEHNESTTEGAKGGGPEQTTSTTTYTYSASFAVLLCEGEILGVRRIWADGKLIYDLSNSADAETLVASYGRATGVTGYTGSDTQMPDTVIESYEGAGNVPAYRGRAYLVFDRLQLAQFGNRIPNIEAEVIASGTRFSPTRLATFSTPLPATFTEEVHAGHASVSLNDGIMTAVFLDINTAEPRQRTTRTIDLNGNIISDVIDYVETVDAAGDMKFYYCSNNHRLMYCVRTAAGGENVNAWYVDGVPVTRPVYPAIINDPAEPLRDDPSQQYLAVGRSFIYFNDYIYAIDGFASLYGYPTLVRFPAPDGVPESRPDAYYRAVLGPGFSDSSSVATDGTYIYLVRDVYIYRFDTELNLLQTWQVTRALVDSPCVVYQNRVAFYTNRFELWDISGTTAVEVGAFAPGDTAYVLGHQSPVVFDKNGSISIVDVLTADTEQLSDILTNICERVSVESSDINVTQLTDEVDGYGITRQSMARACIEPLQKAFFFDAVESDYVLKFVKRGGAVAATIPYTDLAAHEYGSEQPDYLTITKALETELPRNVNVLYPSKAAAYQQGIQQALRQTGSSEHDITMELPIVMTDTKAKQVADASLYLAWSQKTSYKFTTWLGYDNIEPTDVVTITTPIASHTIRITKKDKSTSGVLSFEGVEESASIYTQTGTPGVAPVPSQTVSLAGPTVLYLLDIPLLRDQDEGPNFYAAAAGYLDGWHGATVYKSSDDGASYSASVSFISACTIGETTTALGNWTGGNVWDEGSTVDVQIIGSGTLSSTTEAAPYYALIGNEIVAFKNASLVATKKYRLSGFLRGRRGTDWAQQGHVSHERFVLLSSSALKLISGTTSEIGVDRTFKGVSIGTALATTQAQTFTNSGAMLKPLKPVHIGGGRNGSDDVIINWIAQARKDWRWRNFVDVELDSGLTFEIEILDAVGKTVSAITNANPGIVTCNSHGYSTGDLVSIIGATGSQEVVNQTYTITVLDTHTFSIGVDTRKWNRYVSGGTARKRVRLLTSSGRTVTYTSAQQTTDFGGIQSTIYVKVYPVSTTVGRGFPGYTII